MGRRRRVLQKEKAKVKASVATPPSVKKGKEQWLTSLKNNLHYLINKYTIRKIFEHRWLLERHLMTIKLILGDLL